MKRLFIAFQFALDGLRYAFKQEKNFRIEIFFTLITILLSYFLSITSIQFLVVIINIGFVLAAELFNTSIESICNHICKENNPAVKIIKDTAAAAVVVTAISAIICGTIIFIPQIFKLIIHA